ncbi:hypothetical protein MMC30_004031 [Trapelia coarctata]|nr:hypothetical protein [Trapelia coarctata]
MSGEMVRYNLNGGNREVARSGRSNYDNQLSSSSSIPIKFSATNKKATFMFMGPEDSRYTGRALDIAERMTK